MKMASTSSNEMAKKTWELENNIETIPQCDEIYRYDASKMQQIIAAK